VLLTVSSLCIAFLVARINIFISPVIVLSIFGILFIVIVFYDYRWGFYGGVVLTSIMFYFERIIPVGIPYGVVCDLSFVLAFLSLLFNKREKQWVEFVKHPITLVYLLIFAYQLFQIFNPNAVSLSGWLVSIRALVFPLIMLTSLALIASFSGLKLLMKVWLLIATVAGLYGIFQEFFGLTGFEMRWVTADPLRYGLYFILGHMRTFSFLSDPASFGVFMAYSSLAAFCLMFAPLSPVKRFFLGLCSFIMAFSMIYSGTRTAYAMVLLGIVFFILITLRKKVTFIVAFLLIGAFLVLMFGPFYNQSVMRLRSAFRPSADASMDVRDVKRANLQPYIWAHPMGGGMNTTGSAGVKYSAGHQLAGGWDTDSGYLKVALEQGWIGLTLLMIFFMMVMVKGINNYFNLSDPMLQAYNLAFLIPFFAVSIGNFTQIAILYKPLYIFVITTYAVIIGIEKLKTPR